MDGRYEKGLLMGKRNIFDFVSVCQKIVVVGCSLWCKSWSCLIQLDIVISCEWVGVGW